MDIGVFIPIGNNGWLISNTSPQYKPSYDFNLEIVKKAESYGFEFALSMIKFRGFGGDSEFWDYNLESFTLMAGLAAATERIKLYASAAVLALPPAVAARMATTVDSISHGRFGVNLVSGWAKDEYAQMGIWPGDVHFERRYRYSEEYVRVMQDLWTTGVSDFKGEFFTMEDCKMLPMPETHIPVVSAGQSAVGIEFAAKYADYNFVMGLGINTPTAHAPGVTALAEAAEKTGRDVGAYVLFMIISAETDDEAQALWKNYNDGIDMTAIGWMIGQAASDTGDETSTAKTIAAPEGAVNLNMGTLVGSYETVARLLDEAAEVHGTKGIMLVFDDFIKGMDDYGTKIQPLMTSRADVMADLSVS